MNCCLPPGVDTNAPVKSEVIMERTWASPLVAGFALLYTVVTLGLCAFAMASFPSPEPCVGKEVWEKSKTEILKQVAALFTTGSGALAEVIEQNTGAMMGGIGMMFGAVFFLLAGFRFIPKIMTWALSCVTIVIWVAMGVYMMVEFKADIAYALFAAAAFATIILIWKRSAVNEAAMLFKAATYCIFANPSMILMTLVIQLCLLALGTLMIAGTMSAMIAGTFVTRNAGSTCIGSDCLNIILSDGTQYYCQYQRASWGSGAYNFLSLSFTYQMLNFKMIRLYMVSVVTALWYWETDSNRRGWKSCLGMKWAMSYGFGVVASAAIIIAIVDQITRQVQSKLSMCMNCCNPLFWILYFIIRVYKEMVYALATFSMILGAITGESFCLSANRAYTTLKGRFSTLFVVSGVSRTVLFSFATIVSFSAFLVVLHVVDTSQGSVIDWRSVLWQIAISSLGLFCCKYSIVTFLLVTILAGVLPSGFAPFLMAMFTGALVNYLLCYFAEVFLDVTNALFAVAEIDRKNGVVPGENCAEGSPGAFANYYYTEMSKQEVATGAAVNSTVPTGTVVTQGVAINAGY